MSNMAPKSSSPQSPPKSSFNMTPVNRRKSGRQSRSRGNSFGNVEEQHEELRRLSTATGSSGGTSRNSSSVASHHQQQRLSSVSRDSDGRTYYAPPPRSSLQQPQQSSRQEQQRHRREQSADPPGELMNELIDPRDVLLGFKDEDSNGPTTDDDDDDDDSADDQESRPSNGSLGRVLSMFKPTSSKRFFRRGSNRKINNTDGGGGDDSNPTSNNTSLNNSPTNNGGDTTPWLVQHHHQQQKLHSKDYITAMNINSSLPTSNIRGSGAPKRIPPVEDTTGDYISAMGTFSIPTFKDSDGRMSSRKSGVSRNNSRGSGVPRSNSRGDSRMSASSSGGGRRRSRTYQMGDDMASASKNNDARIAYRDTTATFDDSDDDNWMEEALLNGISAANKPLGSESGSYGGATMGGSYDIDVSERSQGSRRSQRSSGAGGGGGKLDKSERSHKSSSSRHNRLDASELSQRSNASELSSNIRRNGKFSRGQSMGSRALDIVNNARYRDDPRVDGSDRGGRDTVAISGIVEPRRVTIGDLGKALNDDSLEDYNLYNSYGKGGYLLRPQHEQQQEPPPSALSNIPLLPTIKTYKVTKKRHDEPAGLFLTKAKHGAVLVHSLSPESLFHTTNMHPGQEVLSVNEKRVNDPKMAATLITQARGSLALRVSTVERPRGFQYCQVKRKGNESGAGGMSSGGGAHGLRFVTTSVDGVRRGNPITEGLVRVSRVDSNGLFAKSHPLNRLRVGGIVLTVNGSPVTSGRMALEKVMGSRQLVEVLHCDERVWREDWLWDGLEHVTTGRQRSQEEITASIFGRHDGAERLSLDDVIKEDWDMEWKSERDEVILRKKNAGWAFKLVFSEDAGTCHSDGVENERMPPTDEFDISFLVQVVNGLQRTMMQVLQNMLRRAQFELKFGSGGLRRRPRELVTPESQRVVSPQVIRNNGDPRMQSFDGLKALVEDENGIIEDLCHLANSLLRVDDRDRRQSMKHPPPQDMSNAEFNLQQNTDMDGRRGSTGVLAHLSNMTGEVDLWDLQAMGNVPNADKIREFAARRRRMEEEQPTRQFLRRYSNKSKDSFASSMFSADMLEEYMDELGEDSSSVNPGSSASHSEGSVSSNESQQSPRYDDNNMSAGSLLSPKRSSSKESHVEDNKGNDEEAYITGVHRDVASKYEVSDTVVGSGGFGEVRECTDKKTGQVHVVKTIFKPAPDDTTKINLIRNEILLLHEANHPNIVELKDLFEDSKYVHIVMERCTGGDLFDRVVNENPRRLRHRSDAMKHEARTANAMRSILNVIKYLHSKGIVHRDIKPEHFLLSTDQRETQKIKLIDFGLARKHKPGSAPMTTFTGSPSFVAPEVIGRRYDHMCDMFSTGVTAYFLLTGMLPFDGPTDEETFDLISEGRFKFPSSSVFLSDDARDFITKLLKVNPNARMSAESALNHPWLKKDAQC